MSHRTSSAMACLLNELAYDPLRLHTELVLLSQHLSGKLVYLTGATSYHTSKLDGLVASFMIARWSWRIAKFCWWLLGAACHAVAGEWMKGCMLPAG